MTMCVCEMHPKRVPIVMLGANNLVPLSAFFVCLVVALQCAAHSHVETPMLRVNAFCFADAAGDCGDVFLSGARGDEQKADFYGEEAALYLKFAYDCRSLSHLHNEVV
jgi:hypothetical protein